MKRVMFVGQAMPKVKRDPHDWPSLNSWLYSIGISDEHIRAHFSYSALVDYFPGSKNGSHLIPTEFQIQEEQPRLKTTITSFAPDILVPIGRLSISYCLSNWDSPLKDFVGKSYKANPYNLLNNEVLIIPLPHPSGASTWRHNKENGLLLQNALNLLRENLV